MMEVIVALNQLTWPGVFGLVVLTVCGTAAFCWGVYLLAIS